ncbi:MAG: lipid A biosynthesis acyltransferase [Bacteroidetes bacterium]|nr:lipid A biosynthesis acyltransferase [Bacteroidota bacterium]MBL7104679.1 lipid A biosynthesis acyltransferase [Bacteroidales bacterium]
MSSWKGKTRGGLFGYRFFITILKFLGLPVAYFFLRFVVIYFFLFSPKSFRTTFYYFNKVLNYNVFFSFIKIYKSYFVFGQVLLDKIAILAGFKTNFTFDFDGENHLRKMVTDSTGGLLISAHVGNFEIAEHLLKRLNTKINIVMYDAEHKKIKDYLSDILAKQNVNIIVIKNDYSHIFEINNALKNKELVCIHGDRFVKGSKTLYCDFLGKQALFPTGPFYLALKFKVPVSYVFAMKDTKSHYHFYATPATKFEYPPNFKKRNAVLELIIKQYISELEKIVYKYPEQWFNYYDFWGKDSNKV